MSSAWSRRSIRSRLTVVFTLALLVVLIPHILAVYFFARAQMVTARQRFVESEFEEAVFVMNQAAEQATSGEGETAMTAALLELETIEDVRYQLWDGGGRLIYQEMLPLETARLLPARGHSPAATYLQRLPGGHVRVLEQQILADGRPYLLRTVTSDDEVRSILARLIMLLAAGVAGAVGTAAVAGYLVAGRALAPVRLITERAHQLTPSRLREGIQVVNPGDELGQLTRTFNDLFKRLHDAMEHLRQFSTDASHELRTPLTAMRAVAEVGLGREHPEAHRQCLESVLEEIDSMTRILDGLLMLARPGEEAGTDAHQCLDLAALTHEVAGYLAVLAEEKNQVLEVRRASPVMVQTEGRYLRQAIMNIIENAIKYSPEGSSIKISIGVDGTTAVVAVTDQGPGIPPGDHKKVFERFYRAGPEPARTVRGTGLGLAIAAWAIKACGGHIELDSEPGAGSTFRIVLPAAT